MGEHAQGILSDLRDQLRAAKASHTPLRIIGGDTKHRWWHTSASTILNLAALRGIIAYEPTELVITAFAGTPLHEIQAALAERKQMLGFEPPETGPNSTFGGAVASGLAGPARPYRGGVRDFVLGVRLLSFNDEPLRFGGQVMKNVAGYDVSRMVAGAWGRLGPLTEISVRVIPIPEQTVSIAWPCTRDEAQQQMLAFGRRAWPISGLSFDGTLIRLRLAGAARAIEAVCATLPGVATEDLALWSAWRDFSHPYFSSARALWRVSVPPAAKIAELDSKSLWDWGGALRWVDTALSAERVVSLTAKAGGFARPWPPQAVTLAPALAALESRVRRVFDESSIFNPD
ncbi:MAG: glycolate oxidase subunit GlcE [Gammaproteobacteria bacterium]|nr:glycolate oxidase subunit GlcE [Gammaproteobacteria bacterium]